MLGMILKHKEDRNPDNYDLDRAAQELATKLSSGNENEKSQDKR